MANLPPVPLATVAWRSTLNKGLAVLPWPVKIDRVAWVCAIVSVWAERDRVAFADITPWREDPRWMSARELGVRDRIASLDAEQRAFESELVRRRAEFANDALAARGEADAGARRLLTETGDELVAAVATALRDLGLEVEPRDEEGRKKHEDLRVRHGDFVALVEVKGFARGNAKAADLTQLERHRAAYGRETGSEVVGWLIVNGEYERPPDVRSVPYASEPDQVADLAANDGLVIPTIDLSRLLVAHPEDARQRLMDARGRFSYDP